MKNPEDGAGKNTCADLTSDIFFKDMIYVLTVRSPIARGTIKEIECPELPDSCYLIKAEDIPGQNLLADFSIPVLAEKNLSYIGQPVAILAGPDVSVLEGLALDIWINTEEENPLFSSHESVCCGYGAEDIIVSRSIVEEDAVQENENTESGGGGGIKSISGTYTTGIQEHWYPEPQGAAAIFSPANEKNNGDSVTVYTASQWPGNVRRSVARVLGCDSGKVMVNPGYLALHLDGKIWYPSLVACHAALASRISGRPVKLMLTREEDFLYSPKRNRAEMEIKSTVGEGGKILESEIDIKLDLGAEGIFYDELIDHSCLGAMGVYNSGKIKLSAAGIRSNIPSQGPMAGFGLSQGFFASELHVSRIANALGLDPAEWRKNNFLSKDRAGTGIKNSAPPAGLIDAAAAMSDYYRKWASYELLRNRRREKNEFSGEALRGIGISIAYQGAGFLYNSAGNNNSEAEVRLEKDGSLEIRSSIYSSCIDYADAWRNLAHEILGTDPAMIRFNFNTEEASDSGPATLSRNIGVISSLVARCCNEIREQRFREPLPITVKLSAEPAPAPGWVSGKSINPDAFSRPGWAAAVVEIEIDPVSMAPIVRGIWLAADGGRILSRRKAARTLRTGIIQALGWASMERIHYEEGKIPLELYRSYNIPSTSEIPPIYVEFIPGGSADPKGIGDLPFSTVPAAYVQAVSQAMDHNFDRIPLDVNDVWEALLRKQTEPIP